jgi:CRISPR system Cascade subunit CasC
MQIQRKRRLRTMARFVVIHTLTEYPINIINADDSGAPKMAHLGGVPRQVISSQSFARALRTCTIMQKVFRRPAVRTKELLELLLRALRSRQDSTGVPEETLKVYAKAIMDAFSKAKDKGDKAEEKEDKNQLAALSFFSADELDRLETFVATTDSFSLTKTVAPVEEPADQDTPEQDADTPAKPDKKGRGKKSGDPKKKSPIDSKALLEAVMDKESPLEIALFGRFFAALPEYKVNKALVVSPSYTTHRMITDVDAYTAVDDWNTGTGAGHLGTRLMGSGVFYRCIVLNLDQLKASISTAEQENISELLKALLEAACKVSPNGKQGTFLARPFAQYALVEKTDDAPCNLAAAFSVPITGEDLMGNSIQALENYRQALNNAYGLSADVRCMDLQKGTGTLADLTAFITE